MIHVLRAGGKKQFRLRSQCRDGHSGGKWCETTAIGSESGFTKFRFQAMMQYPEKSDKWHARYDVRAIWHPIGQIFQILHHILEPEIGETQLR